MRIAIAGGTGFIGSALADSLRERGDEVWIISRSGGTGRSSLSGVQVVTWEELASAPSRLEGLDAIVNLAGESINQRWTPAAKRRIIESRLNAAARVASLAAALERKPSAIVNASAVGGYGASASAELDESSPLAASDFLSDVVAQWERAADAIPAERIVKLRIGLVLSNSGGAFPLMRLPYRLFFGGRFGSGSQWMSWIHLEDLVRLILFCLDDRTIAGPVNGTAPEPVANDDFGRAMARAMRRPHWFPVPAALARPLLGEMATLLLDGQRAVPSKALAHGFRFRYPDIGSAMNRLLRS